MLTFPTFSISKKIKTSQGNTFSTFLHFPPKYIYFFLSSKKSINIYYPHKIGKCRKCKATQEFKTGKSKEKVGNVNKINTFKELIN